MNDDNKKQMINDTEALALFDTANSDLYHDIIIGKDDNWYIWDGKIWNLKDKETVKLYIKNGIDNCLDRETMSFKRANCQNYICDKFFFKMETLTKKSIDFNSLKYLVFDNGVLNCETGGFYSHEDKKTEYLTSKLDFDYIQNAKIGEKTNEFLDTVFAGKTKDEFEVIKLHLGYLCNPNKSYDRVIVNYGDASTGKSTFGKMIRYMFGESFTLFNIQDLNWNKTFWLGDMKTKLVALDDDVNIYDWKTNDLKKMSGSKLVTTEVKFKRPISFNLRFGLILNTNQIPTPSEMSDATDRRLFMIDFKNKFKVDDSFNWDWHFANEAENNFSYFLNLYLQNKDKFKKLVHENLKITRKLLRDENVFVHFVRRYFEFDKNAEGKISTHTMLDIYKKHSGDNKMTNNKLLRYIKESSKEHKIAVKDNGYYTYKRLVPKTEVINDLYRNQHLEPPELIFEPENSTVDYSKPIDDSSFEKQAEPERDQGIMTENPYEQDWK